MPNNQNNIRSKFVAEDVINLVAVAHDFIGETSRLYDAYNNEPVIDSIAAQERINFPNRKAVENVHYGGILSMEAAADHLMVFADSLKSPAKTIAPWTCVRGLLESCALASWFLDPSIDVKTRVGRYFSFRYAGFVQQIKLYNVEGNRQEDVKRVEERIKKVETDAISLGYPRVLNKKSGNVEGIGQKMPGITELVGITLNKESSYRLLSAIAHGHHWATHQIGFRIINFTDSNGNDHIGLEKHLEPAFVLYAGNIAITSFAQVLWYVWNLYDWNEQEIRALLDTTFDKLKYAKDRRLWKPSNSG